MPICSMCTCVWKGSGEANNPKVNFSTNIFMHLFTSKWDWEKDEIDASAMDIYNIKREQGVKCLGISVFDWLTRISLHFPYEICDDVQENWMQ